MRYIKLFEEFKIEYDLVKDFPPQGCCKCADVDEADALCEMLELAKYANGNQSRDFANTIHHDEWKTERLTIVWNENRKYFRMKEDPIMFDSSYKLIEFDDYFKPRNKSKGSHFGKKYGI